jgi:hypothetical protein
MCWTGELRYSESLKIAERDALLAKLQASNGVRFAQPVTGGTTP